MSKIDNAQIAREYLEKVWNDGNLEIAEKFLAPDLIQHNPGLPDGRDPLVRLIGSLRQRLPELHFDIRRVIADDEYAVTHSLFTSGVPGGEQAVVDIFRFADGVIVEHWDAREEFPATTASGRPVI